MENRQKTVEELQDEVQTLRKELADLKELIRRSVQAQCVPFWVQDQHGELRDLTFEEESQSTAEMCIQEAETHLDPRYHPGRARFVQYGVRLPLGVSCQGLDGRYHLESTKLHKALADTLKDAMAERVAGSQFLYELYRRHLDQVPPMRT